ncbi:hypothetical protein Aab01nite_18930 [Paractinoplanes abujensis]|uniref:DUF3515 domain-containing protein n=1 Tax=Paractinoplanes abujensis TaxID=882441 RepID=A0A7W7G652_9ACTN|nr:DUF3515 family protein [Actinoplanes abujensis]MBB4697224.1 hypothetical protein [Actinoplanes abujensis]GID18303.1 hypothetical protein Aab01nite_18930 [Actinoplanes abujensis]
MVDLENPPAKPKDKTTRSAALWAALVAVPVAVIVGLVAFSQIAPEPTNTGAAASASAPAPVPSTPVRMAAPALDARTTQVCLAVTSQLPTELRGLPGRKVTAGPEQNAAWGEPAITLACGVKQPVMCERIDGGSDGCVPLDATMLAMDGVCWWAADGPATDVFTTMDREVAVQVSVPGSYEQSGQWANEFSEPVVKTVKSTTKGVPSGCKG